ncbi:MAG: alpha/beta hydrolase [Bacilli bacterium]|nr:alpha/beta hydrolase [Bacilli bacterium]
MAKKNNWLAIVIGIVAGTLVLGGGCAGIVILKMNEQMAPENYTETVKTGGDIEAAYLKNGDHEVAYFEKAVDEDYQKFEVYYPKDLETVEKAYPVLVFSNGTGVKASRYTAQFKHYASWGFIAIGTEEEESWDGVACDACLSYLLSESKDPASILCGKIDFDNAGVIGHSQGGAGVFNAITAFGNSSIYKTAVSLSPTHEEMTAELGWNYDLTKINIPLLMLAGTEGDFETKAVIPLEKMEAMYAKITSPKAMARRLGAEHGHMLYSADGYATAWFMWKLQNDENAAKGFIGENAELLQNSLYSDQKIDL